ncbi:MAG TPA: hypothetical protein VJP02_20755 [Candidatus Sulfotelmatobacter sp.]|nr:hypothetical protein [Candidatus Sulfotelmatobacter sp.]
MNFKEQFCYSTFTEQAHRAEHELASFIGAVTQQYGSEEADLAAEDWLDEAQSMDSPPLSTGQNWRAVTIAASARLANRLTVARHHRTLLVASADTRDIGNILVQLFFLPASSCDSLIVADGAGNAQPKRNRR